MQEVSFNASDLSPETTAGMKKHLAALKEFIANGQSASLRLGKGKEIPLPEALLKLIVQALDGKKLLLVEEDEVVSPEKAAEFLSVSRPFLVKKLDAGEIPFHWVGTHRRIPMSGLVAYQQQRRERTQEILLQMREEAEDLGLYE